MSDVAAKDVVEIPNEEADGDISYPRERQRPHAS